MKKLLGLLILSFLISCTGDDDDPGNGQLAVTKANLLGKWTIMAGTTNSGPFEPYEHDCPSNSDYQEFLETDMLTFTGYDTNCEISEIVATAYAVSNNQLTVTNTGNTPFQYVYEVVSLTASELILEQNSVSETDPGVGQFHLTRQ